jgi:hypothetical protein
MVCISITWFVAPLVLDAWVAGAISFVAAALFAAGGRHDR